MDANSRREAILSKLQNTGGPVSAAALAAEFSVSRQVIVGDIALLRAAGHNITATPRGYFFSEPVRGIIRKIACNHTAEQMRSELEIMVDNGCIVKDVIVEHAVYGEITAALSISSRFDVAEFIRKTEEAGAQPLSRLTGGVHLHTLVCPDDAAFNRVCKTLESVGILYKEAEL